jgi:C-terminal processing protease CtpA/Prc
MTKKIKPILIVLSSLLLIHCGSVKKHNAHIDQLIRPELLKKDVAFVKKKLTKHQPNLDWYISKDSLDTLFKQLDNQLTQPLKPNDFFFQLSPLISSIKQGHTRLSPLGKRISKLENKRYKSKGLGPLSQFEVVFFNDSLYISKNETPDSTIQIGTQILKIDNLCPTALFKKFKKTVSSDGYNETYYRHWFNRSFNAYFTLTNGVKDSLNFTLKSNDSIFNFTTFRLEKEKKKKVENESIVVEKSKEKEEKLSLRKKKKIFGWVNNQFAKELIISKVDSTIAILNLKNFSSGNHKKAYALIFEEIKKKNIKHLIIDLRNNPGGKIADNVHLYSYLTDKPFIMNKKSVVNSKASTIAPLFNHSPIWMYPLTAVAFPFFATFQWLGTTKNEKGQLVYHTAGSRLKQPNPLAYNGQIYVLINGGSFSAASIFSAKLKADKRAVFFGEETGGAYNGTVAGLKLNYKLPYSKLNLNLWIMDIRMFDENGEHGKGVMPDLPIKPELHKILSPEDEEIDEIIAFIMSKKK